MQGLAETSRGLVRRRRRDSTCGDASVIDSARKVIAKSCLEASIMGSLISNAYYRSRSGARENCLPRFQRTHSSASLMTLPVGRGFVDVFDLPSPSGFRLLLLTQYIPSLAIGPSAGVASTTNTKRSASPPGTPTPLP
jgi:hypothetical protein